MCFGPDIAAIQHNQLSSFYIANNKQTNKQSVLLGEAASEFTQMDLPDASLVNHSMTAWCLATTLN